MGIVSFIFTMLGIYSIEKIVLSLFGFLILSAVCVFSFRNIEVRKSIRLEIQKPELIFLILFSLMALYLYAGFPTWYLDGGRDQGQYTIFGVVISKTGGLNLEVPDTKLISEIFEDSVLVDYQSIASEFNLGLSNSETYRSPRFFHILPAYLAIGYDLFGIGGLLRVNAVFGFFSVFLLYLVTRRMSDPFSASFISVLYVLNSSQLWNVRSALSEAISQFLILLTAYLIQIFFKRESRMPMFIIGLVFGISSFARVDSYVYLPALVMYSGFLLVFFEKYFKNSLYFIFAFLLTSVLSFVYAYFYSKVYVYHLWEHGFLNIVGFAWVFSLVFLLLEVLIWKKSPSVLGWFRSFAEKNKRTLRISVLSALFLAALLAYFVRPMFLSQVPALAAAKYLTFHSLSVFFWYVPFWLFAFLIFTFDLFIFRRKFVNSSFVFFIGFFLLTVYLASPSIAPDHFWASRRWMLFSIPFAILGSVIGIKNISNIKQSWKTALLLILAGAGIIYTVWRSKLILFQPMMEEYENGYEIFANSTPDENSFYFTTKRQIASPLRYIYGKNIYLINDSEEFLQKVPKLLSLGKRVHMIQNGGLSGADPYLKFTHTTDLVLKGSFPAESIQRYPEFLYHKNLNLQTYELEISQTKVLPEPIQFDWMPANGGFFSRVGEINSDGTISATRHQGPLVYGPLLTLPKGKYKVEFSGVNLDRAKFDVVYNGGSSILYPEEKGEEANSKALIFEIKSPVIDDVEFRVFVEGKSGVKIQRIKLARIL
ncbi:putative membrane protein [Leptospira johnsonii]|uniref:Putative membrane protein n=2 Tax=Leptospira johnsonii TaxID=1917820 RepID=A0A2P2D2S1_9LEPT|nr:putative membrane protein [Leptospira johnsonii]